MCVRVCVPRLLVVLLLYKLLMTAKPNRENERSRSRLAEDIQENQRRISVLDTTRRIPWRNVCLTTFAKVVCIVRFYQLFINYFALGNVRDRNVFNLFTRALLVCYFNYEKVEDHVQRRMIKFALNIREE